MNKVLKIIFIVLLLVVIGCGGYFLLNNKVEIPQQQEVPTPQIVDNNKSYTCKNVTKSSNGYNIIYYLNLEFYDNKMTSCDNYIEYDYNNIDEYDEYYIREEFYQSAGVNKVVEEVNNLTRYYYLSYCPEFNGNVDSFINELSEEYNCSINEKNLN